MSPAVKYTLGRFGLFVAVLAALLPVPLNFFVKAMIALIASAAFSFFLLAKWRQEMAEQLSSVAQRRAAEKRRLRAALAGDDEAAAEGDRAAASDTPAAGETRAAREAPAARETPGASGTPGAPGAKDGA